MNATFVDGAVSVLNEFRGFMESGGFVMWPLLAATVLLWFGIAYRAMMLRRGSSLPVRRLIDAYEREPERETSGFVDGAVATALRIRRENRGDIRRILDDELFPYVANMSRYRTLVRTIVLVAPLAGLLGTVNGMIEMFQSLGTQTFYSQSGGVANGISRALITTQFGLVVAIPGMIVGRLLDRREHRMNEDIEQIKEHLSAEGEEVAS
jgi:biopolymer transport protein ExbB